MEEAIKCSVIAIQLGIIDAKDLMHKDPAAAMDILDQAESLCESTVDALKELSEAREIEEATAEIWQETARLEKKTRWFQVIALVFSMAALAIQTAIVLRALW